MPPPHVTAAISARERSLQSNDSSAYGLIEDRTSVAYYSFGAFPRIETKHLVLRDIRDSDAEALFRMCSDRQWMAFWGLPIHQAIDDTHEMIRQIRRQYVRRQALRWAITRKGSDEAIGSIGFNRFLPQHHRAEITGELTRAESRKGYATEAGRAVVRFGFEKLGLHTIEANIDPQNAASIAVVVGLGFRREGYLRQNYFLEGKFYDTVIFSLLNAQSPFAAVASCA